MSNLVFVITGVNKGFGLSLLKVAMARGYVTEGISKSPRSELIPSQARFTQLDCSDPVGALEFWKQFLQTYGSDTTAVLINNAGTYVKKDFEDTDFSIIDQVIRNNFYSAVNMAKGLMTNFVTGVIINIVSSSGMKGAVRTSSLAQKSAYSAAKAAEAFFFSALQDEYKRARYRITNIYPYTINTWSEKNEPGCIEQNDLADWIISTALLRGSFSITECVVVPFESLT